MRGAVMFSISNKMKQKKIAIVFIGLCLLFVYFGYHWVFNRKNNVISENKKEPPKEIQVDEINDIYHIESLKTVLENNGIDAKSLSIDTEIKEYFNKKSIAVPDSYKKNVNSYLYSKEAISHIDRQTSKPGILSWYIHSVIYLKNDTIFAEYEDGEMEMGQFVAKINDPINENIQMKILWIW